MLAGPQLIGIQPNEGALITDGTVRDVSPRLLTFRFDQDQQIDPSTLDAIQITRAGDDGQLGTSDDQSIPVGSITVGDPDQNEVLLRFASALPDDKYRIEIFAFDDTSNGITGLRNLDPNGLSGELLVPQDPSARKDQIDFELDLGAQIEAVVPQPVVRSADGSLTQRRDQVVVYFNEDPLFVENDADGNPTQRSAENPRFYQLLFTRDTVRTADDELYFPARVEYNESTHTATLFFEDGNGNPVDINALAVGSPGGGTFRLRIGTAVDTRTDLIVTPNRTSLAPGTAGDTFSTAFDVGALGAAGAPLSSLIVSESIDPTSFAIELPGGNDDPGHRQLPESVGGGFEQHINDRFGPDTTDGVTTVPYNFQTVYATSGGTSLVNQINGQQRELIRQALSLWANYVGVQFIETSDQGVTFALGDDGALSGLSGVVEQPGLDFSARVDENFVDSTLVLDSQRGWKLNYGEDFFRTSMAGIGILLGLEFAEDLSETTLLNLSSAFLNGSIDQTFPVGGRPNEPIFPGNDDITHGQYLFRPDSNDIDMYRFQIDLDDADRTGTFTAETFAERLSDASLLDTTLTLYQETKASVVTDFNAGSGLSVALTAVAEGALGNRTRIDFIRTDRVGGDLSVRITPTGVNSFRIDVPRQNPSTGTPAVTVGSVVDAINNDAFASSLVSAAITLGDRSADIGGVELNYSPLILSGGGMEKLARNDDYFSEDSLLRATLGSGTYYVGIAASGNDDYDPNIPDSGYGGRTQGKYDLQLKFEAQVDEVDVLRDRDGTRSGVPGTALDGDGDGLPGGVHNFWFQTRPENRLVQFNADGAAIAAGQTFTVTGAGGVTRTFEFVPTGSSARAGNIAVTYQGGTAGGVVDPVEALAQKLRQAINSRTGETGVRATSSGSTVRLVGERSIDLSEDFVGAEVFGRTIFVDKTAAVIADGTLERPFNNISNPDVPNAFAAATDFDIVRIVGNGGQDNRIETEANNFSYQIGTDETFGRPLEDGSTFDVPRNVTVMIDAGAAFKLRAARLGVGSSNLQVDRSGGVLQVLGTPRLIGADGEVLTVVDADGNVTPADGDVVFTSRRDRSVDRAAAGNQPAPTAGNWGGIVFRKDLDDAEGRENLENEGIFLQYVNHADIRYGGSGNLLVDSIQRVVNPIQIIDVRPTVTFNTITFSADAAMSAAPDSFEETSFQSPRFQQAGAFTSDYDRVGPDIRNNVLANNSINGLFVRVATASNLPPESLTVAGRLDDVDIVHYVAENIIVEGTPGGPLVDSTKPRLRLVTGQATTGGSLTAGTYDYRMTFVDPNGFETLASDPTGSFTVQRDGGTILLAGLPPSPDEFQFRRLYRRDPASGDYLLVDELNASDQRFVDTGRTTAGRLDLTRQGIRGRLDASLVIDPGTVVKLSGARIEMGHGTQLLAEGVQGQEVVFTSIYDDRYGAGGAFDTNNDDSTGGGEAAPVRGDWAGIYAGPTAHVSLDHSIVAFGGGISSLEGPARGFNPVELQQATARITNSVFEQNDDGQDGAGPSGRFGRLAVTPATIFVRGSQPVIVGNTFVDNTGSVIDIDLNSLTADYVVDAGRQTGDLARLVGLDDNRGPLVRRNALDNNGINGMEVRAGELINESVWDDTDIVHVLFDSVVVGNFHSSGGLRLQSRPDQSLVVKLSGEGSPFSATSGTGFTATGTPGDIVDRIGGRIQVLGLPGAPVVMTSLADDTVGAGLKPDGSAQTDTNNDRHDTRPEPNDWRSVLLDQYSQNNNIATLLELESPTALAPGRNATTSRAQVLGTLAGQVSESDENTRLGFDVEGFLSAANDIDTYSFTGKAGTDVWIDIDQSSFTLDTVIELLDSNGTVLARSDNSFDEVADPNLLNVRSSQVQGRIGPLRSGAIEFARFGAGGLYEDFGSTNPRDAGMRVSLPGVTGARSVYFFRVRSASVAADDVDGGVTGGGYRFQVRLAEAQEFAGSTVKHADIRYSNVGVHVRGLPGNSPLLGEAQEDEAVAGFEARNDSLTTNPTRPGQRAQYLGNLLVSDRRVVSVGGELSSGADVDFFQFDVDYQGVRSQGGGIRQMSTIFDVDYADGLSRPDTNISVFYDADGESGPAQPELVLFGAQSNIAEDQSSPLAAEVAEILERGSIRSGDPFIGPVSLPEGTYFVAITNSNQIPAQLSGNTAARREPVNSVRRVVDDHIESIGGATAEMPVVPQFIDQTNLPAGWEVTTARSGEAGHGLYDSFDQTRNGVSFSNATQLDREPNNTLGQAQNLDAIGNWSLQFNSNIGDSVSNTSTTIPHTTIIGAVNDAADIYRFRVNADDTRMIFDIDDAANFGLNDLNGELWLIDASDNSVIASNTVSSTFNGAGGSVSAADPYIETTLDIGTYYIAVTDFTATYDAGSGTFTDNSTFFNGPYTLHVSQEGHAAQTGPSGNASLRFDPNSGSGSIRTATFDLSGYSAADQPFLYFNYLLDDGNSDSVNVRVVDESGNATLLASSVGTGARISGDGLWNQARLSLDAFAGQDGLKIEFEYVDGGGVGNDGLFLDDFIIGFAERGEMIVGATPGDARFVTSGSAGTVSDGEYQLEMRPGTNYVQASPGSTNAQTVVSTFDTNDRHGQHVTVLAPEGIELRDGDTFVLNDGGREVIFEFDDMGNGPANVALGNIRIPFRQSDPANVIATAMRDAINDPAVQAVLDIEAAAADGADSGLMTDNRINLSGSVQTELFDGAKQPIEISASNDADSLATAIADSSISVAPGASLIAGVDSAGIFGNGASTIRIDSGVVLSTGSLSTAEGPNLDDRSGGIASGVGNADTDVVSGGTSVDSTSITLPFELAGGSSSHIYLQAVFASEEYRNEIPGQPDGVSVVLVDTLTGDETQLALLPNGDAVSSATINDSTRADLFNNNDPFEGGRFLREFGFDGFTDRLVFTTEGLAAPLVPGRGYELRIAVADNDASVNALDSALFIGADSLSTNRPAPVRASTSAATGHLVLPAVIHNGVGDTNVQRAQSQLIIDSNRISDVRSIGVWSEPGDRATDPEDFRANNEFFGTSQNPFLQLPPIHSTLPGAVRNLPALNDSVIGGLAPGVVVVNNVIDQAGYAGVHVQGQVRPFVLFGTGTETLTGFPDPDVLENNFGNRIPDGLAFAIDAGGTRVVFEFEDISGSTTAPGSRVIGGDGWTDGHVPVYYRRDHSATYNPNAPGDNRNYASTSAEIMHSIHDSILGSILVTNGLVQLVKPYVAPSYFRADPILEEASTHNLDVPYTALYLDGISNIYFTSFYAKTGGNPIGVSQAPVHEAVQPSARIVNNTIYGADGTESLFVEAGTREGNDTLATAVDTKQGISHTGPYTTSGSIGDNINPLPGVGDVDFYQFELGSGDRAVIDIDTLDTSPQTFLGIDFPQGASSFADRIVLYDPLAGGGPAATAATDPAAVIGPPQGTLLDSLSLSEGGVVVVEFTDNTLVADGTSAPDLHIFETGSNIEPTFVDVSVDGVNFISVGRADGATSSIDIDQFSEVDPNAEYRFVRLTDDASDAASQQAVGVLGADIDAVGAISSRALPLDTVLRVFNSRGEVVATNDSGSVPGHLEAGGPGDPGYDPDTPNPVDPFIDFTATEPGTYYVGVSSKGNDSYDPFSLGNRTPATGGRGNYDLKLEVLAPRTFVMNFNNGANLSNLVGTTFTVTQIPDLAGGATNDITFEFTGPAGGRRLPNGNIRIPLRDEPAYRVPDVMRAISDAINGTLNDPSIPNHEFDNGPEGLNGPIKRATSMALGGADGNDVGLNVFGFRPHVFFSSATDLNGFGHNRTAQVGSTGIAGSTTGGNGTTELYVFLEGAAKVELSPEAVAAGLGLDPQPGTNYDQLLPETGVLVSQGASPSVLNNLIINTHEGVVREETRRNGFGRPGTDLHPKPQDVIVTGNIFQHNGGTTPQFRDRIEWPGVIGTGLTTAQVNGTSNVNGGTDDFNQTLADDRELMINPAGDEFLPSPDSPAIDSAINSLRERDAFAALKQAIGIPVSNVLAPERDLNGLLRVDDPDVASPGGIGGFVFKDRGALDRADFIGPVAHADQPVDNATDGSDQDPAVSFIRLKDGTFAEFRIKIQDTGDAANPFVGTGIDDTTIVGPVKPGVRKPGAALTLFENDRMLVEGIDYTFNYNATENLIVLKPLAGIWKDSRSYRVELNNRDRFVVVAPSAPNTSDGDQFLVTDSQGGQLAFEFESGYDIELPEALTISIPVAGTGTGGISDGDRFTLDDGTNPAVTFEFDRVGENLVLPSNVRVPFSPGDSREQLAAAVATAVADAGLDVTVVQQGTDVVIGAEAGATLETTNSGLEQAANTLTLVAPSAGANAGGVADGDRFIISDGETTVTFEFETANGVGLRNVAVPVAGASTAGLVIDAMRDAILSTDLNVQPVIAGNSLILDLPSRGSASVGSGQLRLLGLARTPADGEIFTFTPTDGGAPTVFELNRTDDGNNDGVSAGNIAIDFSRDLTADQLAERIAQAIGSRTIVGLDTSAVRSIGGGIVSVGGTPGLGLTTTGSSDVEVVGDAGVTGPTSLKISGPLLLQVPSLGGLSIPNGTQFTVTNNGTTTTFEYNLSLNNPVDPNAVLIPYNTNDSAAAIAAQTAAEINSAGLGVNATASASSPGTIVLGDLAESQVDAAGTPLVVRRGTVSDGERVTITQQGVTLRFEFDNVVSGGGVAPGAIPVPFQASGTVDDVALALAAAINNNRGNLRLNAQVEPGGIVNLNDAPGTTTNAGDAASVTVFGVPGGATEVRFDRSFTRAQMKRALLNALNSVNVSGEPAFTTLSASDRGGDTIFVENAIAIGPDIENYFLRGIADNADNTLRQNRDDNTTQFSILLPTVGLDYGDAPDPLGGVRGRYPTRLDVDGARHVIGDGPLLGRLVDAEADGQPTPDADGDDTSVRIIDTPTAGSTFTATETAGVVEIQIAATRVDGETITLDTGIGRATFEFDTDGIFDEDNFAVAVQPGETSAEAFARAIAESPLRPADVEVQGDVLRFIVDDEDGVQFSSANNAGGVFNKNFFTPIDVTFTGTGVLEAWIDFNGDGDWDDPGEQIINGDTPGAVFADADGTEPVTFNVTVPLTSPRLNAPLTTYARFRVSREGGLSPSGLALSGEVEDYRVRILPGSPPSVDPPGTPDGNQSKTYTVLEGATLQVFDADGGLTETNNDNGILFDITDPEADPVRIVPEDVGTRRLEDENGHGGLLDVAADGTFSFTPDPLTADADFFGELTFEVRVTDVRQAGREDEQLVSPNAVTVTIDVQPVNDPPVSTTGTPPSITINALEDEVINISGSTLINGFFVPGPANEFDQAMVVETVGFRPSPGADLVPFETRRGGSVVIRPDGSIRYTPPADYNGPAPDEFIYTVADVPTNPGEVSQTSTVAGTVTINFTAVNDPPIARDDNYRPEEDASLIIPVRGQAIGGQQVAGILDNDSPGPSDEVADGQTISLVLTANGQSLFPLTTQRGGTVTYSASNGGRLTYTPRPDFSGNDQFTYQVRDSEGATSTGTVFLNVGGDNDPASFLGVDGQAGVDSITLNESKANARTVTYDLGTWFSDPEGDDLIFEVTSDDSSVAQAQVVGDELRLTLPPFGFGQTVLRVRAINAPAVPGGANGPATAVDINLTVNNTPDAPVVIGTLDPLLGAEDNQIPPGSGAVDVRNIDLSRIFDDPDQTQLSYRVISPSSFANSDLIESIQFPSGTDRMRINLRPHAFGEAEITIGASDGTFEVTDTFTLTVLSVQDAPTGVSDNYVVPVGGRLQVLDPANGLLANDSDPDGDDFSVETDEDLIEGPSKGTLTLNADGTFVYRNTQGGDIGGTDQFTYRLRDPSGLSEPITVTLTFERSEYQNPIDGLNADVTADGFVTPIDALRIINLFNRRGSISIPVSSLTSAPPDFYDVDGNGVINPTDALGVIRALNERSRTGAEGEGPSVDPRAGTTVDYAAIDPVNLPQANVALPLDDRREQTAAAEVPASRDAGWQAAYAVVDNRVDAAVEALQVEKASDVVGEESEKATDRALFELFDEITVDHS